jgi:hypothetical protein
MLERLSWYARRLAVMERGEIRHRIGEQLARRRARRERRGWPDFLVQGARPEALELFAPLFGPLLPEPVDRQFQTAADAFRSGTMRLLNLDWPRPVLDASGCMDPTVWLLDPVSGASWPGAGQSAFGIDFRFNEGHGDVKYVAEANRLHFLAAPAIHARRTSDARLAGHILGSVLSWMEANPPGRGINWYSGIECGYRLAALACIVAALEPWIDTAAGERLAAFVNAHGTWLARFPSLYSSANNHLVAEAMGLVLAARLLPAHPDAPVWLATGTKHLQDRALALFHEDGVGQEQSPAYSAFTLEMLLIGFRALGPESPAAATRERLARAAQALNAFLDDAGGTPSIGDDDQSRVLLAYGSEEPRYTASIAAAIAGFLDRADLAPWIRDPHWRDVVFAAPCGGAPPPTAPSRSRTEAIRSGAGPSAAGARISFSTTARWGSAPWLRTDTPTRCPSGSRLTDRPCWWMPARTFIIRKGETAGASASAPSTTPSPSMEPVKANHPAPSTGCRGAPARHWNPAQGGHPSMCRPRMTATLVALTSSTIAACRRHPMASRSPIA